MYLVNPKATFENGISLNMKGLVQYKLHSKTVQSGMRIKLLQQNKSKLKVEYPKTGCTSNISQSLVKSYLSMDQQFKID